MFLYSKPLISASYLGSTRLSVTLLRVSPLHSCLALRHEATGLWDASKNCLRLMLFDTLQSRQGNVCKHTNVNTRDRHKHKGWKLKGMVHLKWEFCHILTLVSFLSSHQVTFIQPFIQYRLSKQLYSVKRENNVSIMLTKLNSTVKKL